MAKAVDKYLNDNEAVVSVTPEFQAHHTTLKSKCTEIEVMNNQRYSVFVGKVTSKQSEKNDVINKALAIRGALYAYAKKIKNNELMERTKVTRSVLEKIRDTELLGKVKSFGDLANEHSAATKRH